MADIEHSKVDCPFCGAPAGYPCNSATEGVPQAKDHRERLLAEIERLREPLTLIAEGHIAPQKLAQLALYSPHGIGDVR